MTKREFATLKPADGVEKGILENRVAKKRTCKQCLFCCYRMMCRYSLDASLFSNLLLAYEYLLTLSFTQIAVRLFSESHSK